MWALSWIAKFLKALSCRPGKWPDICCLMSRQHVKPVLLILPVIEFLHLLGLLLVL